MLNLKLISEKQAAIDRWERNRSDFLAHLNTEEFPPGSPQAKALVDAIMNATDEIQKLKSE
jgi:hypothetical protein